MKIPTKKLAPKCSLCKQPIEGTICWINQKKYCRYCFRKRKEFEKFKRESKNNKKIRKCFLCNNNLDTKKYASLCCKCFKRLSKSGSISERGYE